MSEGFLSFYFLGNTKRAYILGHDQAFGKGGGRKCQGKQGAKQD